MKLNELSAGKLINLLNNGGYEVEEIKNELILRLNFYDKQNIKKTNTQYITNTQYLNIGLDEKENRGPTIKCDTSSRCGNHYEGVDEFPGSDY